MRAVSYLRHFGALGLPLVTVLSLGCTAHTQSPGVGPIPTEALPSTVDAMAQQVSPTAQRIAPIYESATTEEDGHTDWNIPLQPGQCYLFAGIGGGGVKHLYLYLWGPGGNRVATEKPERPDVTLRYCPTEPGQFHLQAKTGEGFGPFAIGVYADSGGQPGYAPPAGSAPGSTYVPPPGYPPPSGYAPPPAGYAPPPPPSGYAPPPAGYAPPPPPPR